MILRFSSGILSQSISSPAICTIIFIFTIASPPG
jgi:hypothetical protein